MINPEKLETELGWRPLRRFAPEIAETVGWYRDNRDWWERIIADKGELGFDWSRVGADSPRG